MTEIIEREAKSIFVRTKIPGARYVINQYVGCQHACLYCYAKFMCRWRNYGEWGSWVEAKINSDKLARKFVEGKVVMSSVSDPYQPIEKELELTRRVLENMNKNVELSILTKSNLVVRDIDLFKKFEKLNVGLTINNFENGVKRSFEPFSPSHGERLDALKLLNEEEIKTYAFISPVVPELVDLKSLISETRDLVNYYIVELINLRAGGNEFRRVMKRRYPRSYEALENREKFERFVEDVKETLMGSNINVLQFVIHRPTGSCSPPKKIKHAWGRESCYEKEED